MHRPSRTPSRATRRSTALSLALASGLALSLLAAGPVAAGTGITRWVDSAADTATPGAACGPAAGYTTVAAAITAAAPGDTIRVCAGDYNEGAVTVRTANLNFIGAHAGVSAGVGGARSGATSTGESTFTGTLTFNAPFGTIDGFTFTSTSNAIYGAGAADGGTVVNNRFVNVTSKGISTYGDFAAVSHNLFADSGWGVHHDDKNTIGGLISDNVFRNLSYAVSSAAKNVTVRDNLITGIKQRGLTLYGSDLTVAGNSIDMPSAAGGEGAVTLTGTTVNVDVRDNIFTGAGPSLWISGGATGVTIDANHLLGTGMSIIRTAGTPLAVGVNWWGSENGPMLNGSLDPARVNNATVASWCIDAACSGTVSEVRAPASPPPAASSAALDALGLPDSAGSFSGGADALQNLDPAAPLSGELPWSSADSWVDVYAYSSPVYLGTFPVVNGKVVLSGLDLSALEAGGHRLVFVGQSSGSTMVAAFSIARTALAAAGAQPMIGLALSGALLLIGAGAWLTARRSRGALAL